MHYLPSVAAPTRPAVTIICAIALSIAACQSGDDSSQAGSKSSSNGTEALDTVASVGSMDRSRADVFGDIAAIAA